MDSNGVYLMSIYFKLMTLTTIGYGSFAYDTREVIACMCIQIIGVVGYAALSGFFVN